MQKVAFNLSSPVPTFTNAVRKDLPPYRIPVDFLHEGEIRFSDLHTSPNKACPGTVDTSSFPPPTNLTGLYLQQVRFDCVLHIKKSGSILQEATYLQSKAIFDSRVGTSYCQLNPVADPSAIESMSIMENLSLSLKVRASDFQDFYQVWSQQVSIPIIPAFTVTGATQKVLLTSSKPSAEVRLSGLSEQLNNIQVSGSTVAALAVHYGFRSCCLTCLNMLGLMSLLLARGHIHAYLEALRLLHG